jgi:hypothetical protein
MSVKFNVTIELSPEDIQRAIVEYVKSNINPEFNLTIEDVTVQTHTRYDMRNEPTGTYLKGALVRVKNSPDSGKWGGGR